MCPKCASECDEERYEIIGKMPEDILVISNGIASFIQENEYNEDLEEYVTFDEEADHNDEYEEDDDEYEDDLDEEDEQDEDYEEDYEEDEADEYEEEIA